MIVHKILNNVFASHSHISVLRVLQDVEGGVSGREIARLSKLAHRTCQLTLTNLESLGLVRRHRGGREHFFSFNRDHLIVREGILPLLDLEREFRKCLFNDLGKALKKHAASIVVYGSVAREEETEVSDVDLCVIVLNKKAISVVREILYKLAPTLLSRYGVKISPLIMQKSEFASKARNALIKEILRDNILISGQSIRSLLYDTK